MLKRFAAWLRPPESGASEDFQKARILHYLYFAQAGLLIIALASAPFTTDQSRLFSGAAWTLLAVAFGGFVLLRRGYVRLSGLLTTSIFTLMMFIGVFLTDGITSQFLASYVLVVLLAGFILGNRAGLSFALLGVIYVTIIAILDVNDVMPMASGPQAAARRIIGYFNIYLFAWLLLFLTTRTMSGLVRKTRDSEVSLRETNAELTAIQRTLEERVRQRTEQLRATLEVGRAATAILDPDELLVQVVNLIGQHFGYYYAAIFLVDENRVWANLKTATGEAGRILLGRGHRLQVGGRSMVGAAIATGQARIALDVGEEPIRFDNPFLPETRSEIALPLISAERILGALDVQSQAASAFSNDDIETLQHMANQVAIAMENARLFQQTRRTLAEAGRLQTIPRSTLKRTIQPQTGGIYYQHGQVLPAAAIEMAQLPEALKRGAPVISTEDGLAVVTLPLQLRGESIGGLKIKSKNAKLDEDEMAILEAVAGQLSLALENARLLEDSQNLASRERVLSESTARIRETLDFETILQTATEEMRRALNLADVEFVLGTPEGDSPNNGQDKDAG